MATALVETRLRSYLITYTDVHLHRLIVTLTYSTQTYSYATYSYTDLQSQFKPSNK